MFFSPSQLYSQYKPLLLVDDHYPYYFQTTPPMVFSPSPVRPVMVPPRAPHGEFRELRLHCTFLGARQHDMYAIP